jgi:hypothetical protein
MSKTDNPKVQLVAILCIGEQRHSLKNLRMLHLQQILLAFTKLRDNNPPSHFNDKIIREIETAIENVIHETL